MHPLIKAYDNLARIEKAMSQVTIKLHFDQLVSEARHSFELIDEVMASCQSPEFLVGFLMGHNNQVYIVWLWPLSLEYSQYFYVEDQDYSRPFTP